MGAEVEFPEKMSRQDAKQEEMCCGDLFHKLGGFAALREPFVFSTNRSTNPIRKKLTTDR